jgi:glycosyltransferase involved in cell wall biosynthesis
MMNKKAKIVMITMYKNEASVIRRMLESCLPYVDYYVLQNNGSTDGTDDIVKDFLTTNQLNGEIYYVEEGWVGFGWNRDHLIQHCQNKVKHNCDWILKMDCDEVLEVDDDFDWSPLDNHNTQSFHVAAVSGDCIYHRAWMWNAKLPWRFNHDTCHETIYCNIDGIGEDFERVNLSSKFRQIGFNEGQSWSNPYKFISDALILEEKMIREGTIFSDHYHFWYIGKSYNDCYQSLALPLGETQQKQYAERCIYYFREYIKFRNCPNQINELCYMGLIFSANCHHFLGDMESCLSSLKEAEQYAPGRNEHLFKLAEVYHQLGRYREMLTYTTMMMDPIRTNPFPNYIVFIDSSIYNDSKSNKVQSIHQLALQSQLSSPSIFNINSDKSKRLFVVDNFYSDPDAIRSFALSVEFQTDIRWYKGLRSTKPYRTTEIKKSFEQIIGQTITVWDDHVYNGCFQICKAEDPQVYHYDMQTWAAMIYLSPNAPLISGTRSHRSISTGLSHSSEPGVDASFAGGFYDSTKFEIDSSVGNVYNRLIIMDSRLIHSAGPYFGKDHQSGRLTHLFFFD